jgi:hypothetical protein
VAVDEGRATKIPAIMPMIRLRSKATARELGSRCTSYSIEPLDMVSKRWRGRLTRREPSFGPEVRPDLNAGPKIKTGIDHRFGAALNFRSGLL